MKELFYTPTKQELIEHIINGEDIYGIVVEDFKNREDSELTLTEELIKIQNTNSIKNLNEFLYSQCVLEGTLQDIESFGWVSYIGDGLTNHKDIFKNKIETIGITLRYNYYKENNQHSMHIYNLYPFNGIEGTIFEGSIKNKLELKKLLKQLKINV